MVQPSIPAADPPSDEPGYRSSARRAPRPPLVLVPRALLDTGGPVFGDTTVTEVLLHTAVYAGVPASNAAGEAGGG